MWLGPKMLGGAVGLSETQPFCVHIMVMSDGVYCNCPRNYANWTLRILFLTAGLHRSLWTFSTLFWGESSYVHYMSLTYTNIGTVIQNLYELICCGTCIVYKLLLKLTPHFRIAGLRGNSVSARRSLATESLRNLRYICVLNENQFIDFQNLSPGQSHSAGLMIWITRSYNA